MHPKAKAAELIEKFLPTVSREDYTYTEDRKAAVRISLICVDEILKIDSHVKVYSTPERFYSMIEYWNEVKTEIENL